MARTVRAVSDGDRKYAGFDFTGRRRIHGEVFEWPDGKGLPLVKYDEDGLVKSGWVELVSGEDGGAPTTKKARAKIPGLVEAKPQRQMQDGNSLAPKGRQSDRVIG